MVAGQAPAGSQSPVVPSRPRRQRRLGSRPPHHQRRISPRRLRRQPLPRQQAETPNGQPLRRTCGVVGPVGPQPCANPPGTCGTHRDWSGLANLGLGLGCAGRDLRCRGCPAGSNSSLWTANAANARAWSSWGGSAYEKRCVSRSCAITRTKWAAERGVCVACCCTVGARFAATGPRRCRVTKEPSAWPDSVTVRVVETLRADGPSVTSVGLTRMWVYGTARCPRVTVARSPEPLLQGRAEVRYVHARGDGGGRSRCVGRGSISVSLKRRCVSSAV